MNIRRRMARSISLRRTSGFFFRIFILTSLQKSRLKLEKHDFHIFKVVKYPILGFIRARNSTSDDSIDSERNTRNFFQNFSSIPFSRKAISSAKNKIYSLLIFFFRIFAGVSNELRFSCFERRFCRMVLRKNSH